MLFFYDKTSEKIRRIQINVFMNKVCSDKLFSAKKAPQT